MNRFGSLLGLVVFLGCGFVARGAGPAAQATANDPLADVYPILEEATAKLSSLAMVAVESNGTTEDVSGVQRALIKNLARRSDLLIVSPDEVFKNVGMEFDASPAGLAAVAKKCSAQAVLYPQIIKSADELELTLVVVGDNATILLDRSVALQSLPPPDESVALPQPSLQPSPQPNAAGTQATAAQRNAAAEKFARQALALAMRARMMPGHRTTYLGPFNVVEYEHPPIVTGEDWYILQGGEIPISERLLAQLVGRDDIIQRIDKRVAPLKLGRNVGIGLTVAGFLTAGIAAPFVNNNSATTANTASACAITGLVAGLTGIVLWLLYEPQVAAVESPFPASHTISQDEAQTMVTDYNDALLQK
jgi:hypothetical protein